MGNWGYSPFRSFMDFVRNLLIFWKRRWLIYKSWIRCDVSKILPKYHRNIPQTRITNSLCFGIPFHLGCWGCLVYILQGYIGVPLNHLRHKHQPSTTLSMLRPERWCLTSGHAGGKMSPCNFQNHSLGGGFKYFHSYPYLGKWFNLT